MSEVGSSLKTSRESLGVGEDCQISFTSCARKDFDSNMQN